MKTNLKMIKISHHDKTFLAPRPKDLAELKDSFTRRFGRQAVSESSVVLFDGKDDIFIETEGDLLNVLNCNPGKLTLVLRNESHAGRAEEGRPLQRSELEQFTSFVGERLSEEVDFVDNLSEQGMMPCKHCFFDKVDPDMSLDLDQDYHCGVCRDTRSIPINKCWNVVGLLVESRLRKFVAQPLGALLDENPKLPPDLGIAKANTTRMTGTSMFQGNVNKSFSRSNTNSNLVPIFSNSVK